MDSVFVEIATLMAMATALGGLALVLRQPLIVAFIAVGIIAGPSVLGMVDETEIVPVLAELGIALLLFVVGLKLDLSLIRTMGPVALATGLGQVTFTSVVGFFIALALGMTPVHALYVAVALTFSSTIIIVKLLTDKHEIDALHGRIAVGFLIVQDIVVVLVMIGLSAFGAGQDGDAALWREVIWVLLAGAGMLVFIAVAMRWLLPPLLERLARNRELLSLFAIAWAVALAATGDVLGFSKEVGAFLAGVALASSGYRDVLGARLVVIRDFLLLFFFIHLGAQLEIGLLGEQVAPAIVLSLFVLIGNPLIVLIIMGLMGYRRRTGFLAGLTVAQISEFSLILAALGMSLGHLDQETLGLVTLVGLITITLSTYLILYSHPIYERLAPWLGVFERHIPHREDGIPAAESGPLPEVIVFGLGRYGGTLALDLHRRGIRVLGVDFDPDVVNHARARGLNACYGDAEDPEFPSLLPLAHGPLVVSTVPDEPVNRALSQVLRTHHQGGRLIMTSRSSGDQEGLERLKPDQLLSPFEDAAELAAESLARQLRGPQSGG